MRLRELPPHKAFAFNFLRIVVLTIRGIIEDKCMLRASALTFYSLLSIGPVIALALGIAKGFGLEKRLQTELLEQIPAQEAVLNQILEYANILLENTQGGVIAGIGVALLLWAAVKVFNHLEASFNEIWYVRESRSWKIKISNYLAFMVLAPLFLLMYSSIPAFVTSQISRLATKLSLFATVSPLIVSLLQLLPYLLVWVLFSLVYIMIPNTRVKPLSGVLAGVVAGTAYLAVQWILIAFQVGLTRYNPIYGSLAALPLLLVWMHFGWIILLIGAEIAYAHQSVELYEYEPDFKNLSPYFKRVLTLQILHRLVRQFAEGDPPLTTTQISLQLEIPIHLVQQIFADLTDAGLVSHVSTENDDEPAFQPSSDIHRWTVKYVNDRIEARGVNKLPVAETEALKSIENTLSELDNTIARSPANRLLKDL